MFSALQHTCRRSLRLYTTSSARLFSSSSTGSQLGAQRFCSLPVFLTWCKLNGRDDTRPEAMSLTRSNGHSARGLCYEGRSTRPSPSYDRGPSAPPRVRLRLPTSPSCYVPMMLFQHLCSSLSLKRKETIGGTISVPTWYLPRPPRNGGSYSCNNRHNRLPSPLLMLQKEVICQI